VWPAVPGKPVKEHSHSFDLQLNGSATTHRFTWSRQSVVYESRHGHYDDDRGDLIESWRFAPPDPATLIPQQPLPVHLNLWLVHGHPPTDGREVEVIIDKFSFTPEVPAAPAPATPSAQPESQREPDGGASDANPH